MLYVDSQRHTFDAHDLDAFTALANYASIGIEQARLSEQLLREARRRERLQRYHSHSVIERILTAGEEADTQFLAQEREVSILFCDIVSFTTLCEGLAPNDIVSLLNGFFSKMCDVIFENEGTLDKFIGDEMMVVYNAPFEQTDHALRAAKTALGHAQGAGGVQRGAAGHPARSAHLDCQRPGDGGRHRHDQAARVHRAGRRRQHGRAHQGQRGARADRALRRHRAAVAERADA